MCFIQILLLFILNKYYFTVKVYNSAVLKQKSTNRLYEIM